MDVAMKQDDAVFRVEMVFGTVAIEDRLVPQGARLVGESRKLTYDRCGQLVSVSAWERTGAWVTFA